MKPKATHPLALAPVGSPASSVDGFVREFLRELNFGQGVALSTAPSTTSTWRWPARSATT